MDDIKIKAPPQPGSPQQAQRWLPLGSLGATALIGAIFCVLLTLGFAWLAKGVFAVRFVAITSVAILMRIQRHETIREVLPQLDTRIGRALQPGASGDPRIAGCEGPQVDP